MAETLCGYPDRDEVLVTYLYDDMDPAVRDTYEAHLAICAKCRQEVHELRGVREHLAEWTVAGQTSVVSPPSGLGVSRRVPPRGAWWRDLPAWAQVAAALLVLGASAGLANLDVHYDQQGLAIRTGWSRAASVAAPARVESGVAQDGRAPWRADLTALEERLHSDFQAASVGHDPQTKMTAALDAPRAGLTDAELLRRVRQIVDESEKRQKNELALRVLEVMDNVSAQRRADLIKINRTLGTVQDDTKSELLKQRASISYLVSATQRQ